MTTTLVDLTRELLGNGVFDHLPGDEIERLHGMITQDQLPLQPLLSYWYRGEFYSSQAPPGLLQQCNDHLRQLGQPLIDVHGEELYEA